jgi:hypothetical protein
MELMEEKKNKTNECEHWVNQYPSSNKMGNGGVLCIVIKDRV